MLHKLCFSPHAPTHSFQLENFPQGSPRELTVCSGVLPLMELEGLVGSVLCLTKWQTDEFMNFRCCRYSCVVKFNKLARIKWPKFVEPAWWTT